MINKLLKHYREMSEAVIREIAELHFVRGIPTDALMRQAGTPERRIHVAAVALYSIEKPLLMGLLAGEDPEIRAGILRCHKKIETFLRQQNRSAAEFSV